MSILNQPPTQENRNKTRKGIILGVIVFCFILLVNGTGGGGIALKNSWATATQQELYVRATATQKEAYARATATQQEQIARATATKQEAYARATATKQEQIARATAHAETALAMVPVGIAARFPKVFFYETFDSPGAWMTGSTNDSTWSGRQSVDSSYLWTMSTVKRNFLSLAPLPSVGIKKDFYFQTDVRLREGLPAYSCYGVSFHQANGIGFYVLLVCGNSYYVGYFQGPDWVTIKNWTEESLIDPFGTNQLGVSAEGDNFEIFINSKMVYLFTYDTPKFGTLALVVDKIDQTAAEFEFDNVIVLTP